MSLPTQPRKPLDGIRVLDLTNVLAGPFGGYQLALMGAEVIKIERPGKGDLARQLGADPELNRRNMGISFMAQNAGKRSVTLNMKSPRGKDLLRELVTTADVLVENFRPGVMDRLGLGYQDLRKHRPDLIYCAVTGFGQDGPWRDNPAYDQIVQGVSGVMSVTGTPDTAPLRVGYPMADTIGGMTAAFAICAALAARPRGAFLDVSMTDAVISTMGWVVSNHLIGGVDPQPLGNENFTSAPSGTFKTATGPLNIAANKDEHWTLLTAHLGLEHLRDAPGFATRDERKANRDTLREILERALQAKPAADWARELNAMGVPAGEVLTVPQVLASDQMAQRDMTATYPAPPGVDRSIRLTGSPVRVDGQRPFAPDGPAALGHDTAEVLGDLGYSASDLDQLRADGVI